MRDATSAGALRLFGHLIGWFLTALAYTHARLIGGIRMVALKKWLTRRSRRPAVEAASPLRHSTVPCLERLEDRAVPDATGTLVGNTLNIVGPPQPFERIGLLFDQAANQLVLTNFGTVTQRFDSAAVANVSITGSALNVRIEVAPNVLQPVTIIAGPSVNVLMGGGGPSNIIASQGASRIIGGTADDVISVTTGINTVIDPAGTSTNISGAIRNVFYGSRDRSNILFLNPDRDLDLRCDTTPATNAQTLGLPPSPFQVLNTADVNQLLDRASAATASTDGIIAIVDRTGRILGVRIEDSVLQNLGIAGLPPTDPVALFNFLSALPADQRYILAFAVDGAVAKARTAAFFGNNQAPLTSRVVQNISQTTMTQREIESYPFDTNPNSTLRGPGFVAPIGIKGHFPPGVAFTPQVDLFAIEHTNRDSSYHPVDGIQGNGNEQLLSDRFNANPAFVPQPTGQEIVAPDSYGFASGIAPNSQNRGIGTLPGGIPIYKAAANGQPVVVGGIGVFYPGRTGFASEENSQLNETFNPNLPDRSLEAEFVAFAALGGAPLLDPRFTVGALGGVPPVPGIVIPITPDAMRIDLVGITLDIIGPLGTNGPTILQDYATANLPPGVVNGVNAPLLDPNSGGNDNRINPPANVAGPNSFNIQNFTPQLVGNFGNAIPVDTAVVGLLPGTFAPEGFLINPHDSAFPGGLTAAEVTQMIQQGVAQALITRAAIRLPLDRNVVMVFAVADLDGSLLGLFRMPDSTIFSIDVAVAKSRNVAYYANPNELQPQDQLPGFAPGIAFTNRTFRYLALPRFPEGIDFRPPGPFSILNDGNVSNGTGGLVGPRAPASQFQSVQGFDAFNPQTNFRDQTGSPLNENGIVFFPGAVPLYRGGITLLGGVGISGDGVDQDDVVTFATKQGFENGAGILRADQVFFQNVRLPFQKFNRQPLNP